jgi:hypothetical protein
MQALETIMDIDKMFEIFGQVVAYGGGSAAIAYLLFQYLGKSWIENKFNQRLEQLRHDQALELQKLRVEIDALLSGAIKLQEKEFKVLPEAWKKLDEAHQLISWLVSPMQQYADVDKMDEEKLNEFLDSSEFTNTQKGEIKSSYDKGKTYQETLFWYRLHKAKVAFGDLQKYVARNGIFFEPELKEKLSKISETLWSAVISKEVGHEVKDWKMQNKGWDEIKKTTDPLYKEIEEYIHGRLQSHGREK